MFARRKIILAWLALLLVLAAPLTVLAQNVVVNATVAADAGKTALRAGPGIRFYVILEVIPTAELMLVGRNADSSWVQAYRNGKTGWIAIEQVTTQVNVATLPQTAPTGRNNAFVNTAHLNIRRGPGANFDVVGTIGPRDRLNLVGRNVENSWVQVQVVPSGVTGWVSTRHIVMNVSFDVLPITSNTAVFTEPEPIPSSSNRQVGFVTASPNLPIYYGPGSDYGAFAFLNTGTGVFLRGRNTPGTWLFVQIDSGETGWVNAASIRTTVQINSLPVIGNS